MRFSTFLLAGIGLFSSLQVTYASDRVGRYAPQRVSSLSSFQSPDAFPLMQRMRRVTPSLSESALSRQTTTKQFLDSIVTPNKEKALFSYDPANGYLLSRLTYFNEPEAGWVFRNIENTSYLHTYQFDETGRCIALHKYSAMETPEGIRPDREFLRIEGEKKDGIWYETRYTMVPGAVNTEAYALRIHDKTGYDEWGNVCYLAEYDWLSQTEYGIRYSQEFRFQGVDKNEIADYDNELKDLNCTLSLTTTYQQEMKGYDVQGWKREYAYRNDTVLIARSNYAESGWTPSVSMKLLFNADHSRLRFYDAGTHSYQFTWDSLNRLLNVADWANQSPYEVDSRSFTYEDEYTLNPAYHQIDWPYLEFDLANNPFGRVKSYTRLDKDGKDASYTRATATYNDQRVIGWYKESGVPSEADLNLDLDGDGKLSTVSTRTGYEQGESLCYNAQGLLESCIRKGEDKWDGAYTEKSQYLYDEWGNETSYQSYAPGADADHWIFQSEDFREVDAKGRTLCYGYREVMNSGKWDGSKYTNLYVDDDRVAQNRYTINENTGEWLQVKEPSYEGDFSYYDDEFFIRGVKSDYTESASGPQFGNGSLTKYYYNTTKPFTTPCEWQEYENPFQISLQNIDEELNTYQEQYRWDTTTQAWVMTFANGRKGPELQGDKQVYTNYVSLGGGAPFATFVQTLTPDEYGRVGENCCFTQGFGTPSYTNTYQYTYLNTEDPYLLQVKNTSAEPAVITQFYYSDHTYTDVPEVSVVESAIQVKGRVVTHPGRIWVYNLNGVLICAGADEVEVPQGGLYIIRAEQSSVKVRIE